MREITIREANQDFSQVIAAVEQGETIVITKHGKPVAKVAPVQGDRSQEPERQAAREALAKSLREKPSTGFRVGKITEDDKYGTATERWTRVALDSNLLVCATLKPETER